jgi:DNA-binding GntR family transcriptional regulator
MREVDARMPFWVNPTRPLPIRLWDSDIAALEPCDNKSRSATAGGVCVLYAIGMASPKESKEVVTSISHRSVSEKVSEALRDMILSGRLKPGEKITHDELARRLDVSTMPVREALLRLSYEGLIDAQRNRSFRVAEMTRQDLADVYWMYSLILGELTARAAERADAQLIHDLREIHAQWARLGNEGDPVELQALNVQFHDLINDAAAAPKLLIMLRNNSRFIPEHMFAALVPGWSSASIRNHEAILEALERRDPEGARRAVEEHVKEAGVMLANSFDHDEGVYWSQPVPKDGDVKPVTTLEPDPQTQRAGLENRRPRRRSNRTQGPPTPVSTGSP